VQDPRLPPDNRVAESRGSALFQRRGGRGRPDEQVQELHRPWYVPADLQDGRL